MANRFDVLNNEIRRLSQDNHPTQGVVDPFVLDNNEPDEDFTTDDQGCLLRDDDIGGWLEIQTFLRSANALLHQLDDLWKEAAEGVVPIPFVAWPSICASSIVSSEATYFHEIVPQASVLFEKVLNEDTTQSTAESGPMYDGQDAQAEVEENVQHFRQAYKVLQRFRQDSKSFSLYDEVHEMQKPLEFVKSLHLTTAGADLPPDIVRRQRQADDLAMETMLRNALQRNRSKISKVNDVTSQVGHFHGILERLVRELVENETDSIDFNLVFRLELLLSSYQSFVWAKSTATPRNCRVEALKFVQDIEKEMIAITNEMKNTWQCSKVPDSMQSALALLTNYLEQQCFDLLSQAPLSAGFHMIQFLHFSFDIGLAFSTDFNHVPAVLHLYNAMRNIRPPIRSMPFLNQLCDLFKVALFHGNFPSENFSSHFRSIRGAKLCIGKDGKRRFEVLQRKITDSPRTKPSDMSIVFQLHKDRYALSREYLVKVKNAVLSTQRGYKSPSKSSLKRRSKDSSEHPTLEDRMNIMVKASGHVALKEFTGDLPLALVNLMSVFRTCLRLLEQLIADDTQIARSEQLPSEKAHPDFGLIYIDLLLENIVDFAREPWLLPFGFEKRHSRDLRRVREEFAGFEKTCPPTLPLWTL